MSGTILFVDDDPWLLDAVRAQLKKSPFRVLTATSPLQALPQIEWEGVDVLVTDVAMPDLDGVDLVVRARQLFPDVVRLLLTAGASTDAVIRAVNEAEVFRVLKKPISAEALAGALHAAVERRESLRRSNAVHTAAARRATRLARLEKEHPGLGSVFLPDGVYVLTPERIAELTGRFEETPLASWLAHEPEAGPLLDQTQDMEEEPSDALLELREGYGQALPGKARDLRETLSRARGTSDSEQVKHLRRQAHNLAGTAGVYGYAETGQAFRQLEEALRELEAADPALSEPLWERALTKLSEAEKAVERALRR